MKFCFTLLLRHGEVVLGRWLVETAPELWGNMLDWKSKTLTKQKNLQVAKEQRFGFWALWQVFQVMFATELHIETEIWFFCRLVGPKTMVTKHLENMWRHHSQMSLLTMDPSPPYPKSMPKWLPQDMISYYSKVSTRIYNDYKKADQSKLLPEQWCMKLPQGATSFEDWSSCKLNHMFSS